uniref:Uncharacterized protein n=1 Tax=Oryza glaberrima TaxID=4538 RepID=I1Q1C9_ORYGL
FQNGAENVLSAEKKTEFCNSESTSLEMCTNSELPCHQIKISSKSLQIFQKKTGTLVKGLDAFKKSQNWTPSAGADEEQQLAQRLRGVELPEHHELVERSRCGCRVVFLTELSHCAIHDMDDDAQVNYVTAGERMRSCALSSLQVRLRRGPDLPVASQRRRSHPLHLLVLVLSGSPIRTHSTTPLPASPVSWLGRSGWALVLHDASMQV